MATYSFAPAFLGTIVDHAANLEVEVVSVTLSAGRYSMVTVDPLPDEQLEHLQTFTDIEVA